MVQWSGWAQARANAATAGSARSGRLPGWAACIAALRPASVWRGAPARGRVRRVGAPPAEDGAGGRAGAARAPHLGGGGGAGGGGLGRAEGGGGQRVAGVGPVERGHQHRAGQLGPNVVHGWTI